MRRISKEQAQLLVVDVQERLLPHIHEAEAIVRQARRMIRAARVLRLPVILSEQYVKGLGASHAGIAADAAEAGAKRVEKMAFSVLGDAAARQMVLDQRRPAVIMIGIEAHVCVQQSVLDLLDAGCQPIVLADAVSSRKEFDYEIALERMRAAGAVVTTVESIIYELMERAGSEEFRQMLPIIKE